MMNRIARQHLQHMLGRSIGLIALLTALTATAQEEPSGRAIFNSACSHCHGADGRGGELGPSVVPRVTEDDDQALAQFLRTGSPERGMPPTMIPDEQMPVLLEYLHFLASSPAGEGEATSQVADTRPVLPNHVVENFVPIDSDMLHNPSPSNWLWFSRTADAQRFSPLDQINTDNVGSLALAWARALPDGLSYTIPLVYNGVMYLSTPAASVIALDATTGDRIWEYRRTYDNPAMARQDRSKTLSIYSDMLYYTAPDSTLVAIDARTGEQRWEASAGNRGHSSGSIIVNDMVVSSGNCIRGPRDSCFVAAHDAETGELLWHFNTVQADEQPPGFNTWGSVPLEERLASPWGLPGSYDPELNLILWSIANPMPTSRRERQGDPHEIPVSAPANLYSNSTVALDPDTGELQWYYQHLPGDDWDLDMNQERILVDTAVNPDPEHVKWINPALTAGEERQVVFNIGEGGGIWALDRKTGEFLWASPFPFDTEHFFLKDIDVETGITYLNEDLLVDEPGENNLVCYLNTRSFWPSAYSPERNALYVPYIRNCLNMTSADPEAGQPESRLGAAEPGVAPDELNGLAKIDAETGEITHWPTGRIPTTSAILPTAGDLVFWGDVDREYRAMHAGSGEVLWKTQLSGPISMSNITYSVEGRQYVAVIAGETLAATTITSQYGPISIDREESHGTATLYVFALPEPVVGTGDTQAD